MTPLAWTERDGGVFLDLGGAGIGAPDTYLAVRPHPEPGWWRPVCVLAPGEEERELGDGVASRELAQDSVVKYAIQVLAERAGIPPVPRDDDPDDPWEKRAVARLWELLAAGPR